ncbi:hypothetical protein D3C86_2055990 [compost metagenome]
MILFTGAEAGARILFFAGRYINERKSFLGSSHYEAVKILAKVFINWHAVFIADHSDGIFTFFWYREGHSFRSE